MRSFTHIDVNTGYQALDCTYHTVYVCMRGRARITAAIDLSACALENHDKHVYFDLSTRAWIRFERGTLIRFDLYLTLSSRENLERRDIDGENEIPGAGGYSSQWMNDEFGAKFR